MSDQHNDEYLVPVSHRIAFSILEFCCNRRQFHADDLRQHVVTRCGVVAPGSADRILRDLRKKGRVNYSVDRAASLYTILHVVR